MNRGSLRCTIRRYEIADLQVHLWVNGSIVAQGKWPIPSWAPERLPGAIKNVGGYSPLEIREKKDVYILDKLTAHVVHTFKAALVETMSEPLDITGSSVYVTISVSHHGWLGEWEGEGGGDAPT